VTQPDRPALSLDRLEAGFLASRGIQLPWGEPSDPPDRETVCGLGNAMDRSFVAHLRDYGATPFPTSVAFARRLRELGLRTAVVEDALAGVEAGRRGRFADVVGLDRGGQAAALAERGADVVVTDLGDLVLDGNAAGRAGP
jgi:beta-phosphoglucomutase-like phosphatase (HAD superfamily)